MGRKEGRVFRNIYKGHMDKPKWGRIKDGKWGWLGWGGKWGAVGGGKWRQLYLNNNKKSLKNYFWDKKPREGRVAHVIQLVDWMGKTLPL